MGQIDPRAVAVGKAVRSAVTESGLTLTEFGQQAGFSHATLARRLSGRGMSFTLPELFTTADIVGIEVDEIVARAKRILERSAA